MDTIHIIEPGLFSTIQDCGRFGYQDRGVPVSGAMDIHALRVANILVGNEDHSAAIEITWGGFKVRFLASVRIAITGADPTATLNGQHVPCWSGVLVQRGDILEMSDPYVGCWTYLAISGGVDVPNVMGSRSTYVPGGFGGYRGRVLRKGDILRKGSLDIQPVASVCPKPLVPDYSDHPVLRTTVGPQTNSLIPESLDRFFSSAFEVTDRCDRMGIHLKGPLLIHRQKADIVSDGTVFGAVQVPGNGQPIVLTADRQTIGGYVKPVTVISADRSKLAQLIPGSTVHFESVSLWRARELAVTDEYRLQQWMHHQSSV